MTLSEWLRGRKKPGFVFKFLFYGRRETSMGEAINPLRSPLVELVGREQTQCGLRSAVRWDSERFLYGVSLIISILSVIINGSVSIPVAIKILCRGLS